MPAPRPSRIVVRRTRRAAAAAAFLGLALALPGCSREPRFVPASADSALVAPADAIGEQVRQLQQQWASPDGGPAAAQLSAGLLLADLRAHFGDDPGGPWELRARELLDSLGIGAECAGAPGALAVNFFSRGDPSAGSWPWLFWNEAGAIQSREIEGRGMSLVSLASRGLAGVSTPEPDPSAPAPGRAPAADHPSGTGTEGTTPVEAPGIAALFSRRGSVGPQPFVMVWLAWAGLEQTQALGPDSLGRTGSGAFETPAAGGGIFLRTKTWQPTARFDECATCPHVVHERLFRWGLEGFLCVEDRVVPTPYVAFVRFIQALGAGDHAAARECVTHPALIESARAAGWAAARGVWRAAPGRGQREDEWIFYRGAQEAWKVDFARDLDGWRVDAFETTKRTIE